jgi:1-acyl-sn-glycerol-3-phosphate acyltransferase
MKYAKRFLFCFIIRCFHLAGWLMRQRPRLTGKEYLKNVPLPVIFAVTHDSYFEIPSLSTVFQKLTPRPIFAVMAKKDFLSGHYLSTNFGGNRPLLHLVLDALDRTGIPTLIFRLLNVSTVHRPFVESTLKRADELKQEISGQITHFRNTISQGLSTLVFPEGTTWGYGGLKQIRSSAYQLVHDTFMQYRRKVYVIPINVKADRLVQGCKDIFINVGRPRFILLSKEEFNEHLRECLLRLHTITFSQIGAYYLKKLSLMNARREREITLTRDVVTAHLEKVVADVHTMVENRILPAFDSRLTDKKYLARKVKRFIRYCIKRGYLVKLKEPGTPGAYAVNWKKVLADHPAKAFRKLNPVGYHANELLSLGEKYIDPLFNFPLKNGASPARTPRRLPA